jgi:hypothetical protein
MKFSPALRSPYHPRTIVRPEVAARVSDPSLGRAIAWTQAVLVALCVARVHADRGYAQPTIEGRISLALLVVLMIWVAAEAMGRMIPFRRSGRTRSVFAGVPGHDPRGD